MLVDEEAGPHGPARTDVEQAIAGLSDRQIACLARAGEGLSSKEIGRLLGISPSTVDNHIHFAVAKLNAKNRWEAARLLQPERQQNGAKPTKLGRLVPPLGGSPNTLNIRGRLVQILAIGTISIIALTSFVILVLGAVAVFDLA